MAHDAFDALRFFWSKCVDERVACPARCGTAIEILVQECSMVFDEHNNKDAVQNMSLNLSLLSFGTIDAGLNSLKRVHQALGTAGTQDKFTAGTTSSNRPCAAFGQ